MKAMKKWMLGLLMITAVCFMVGCGSNTNNDNVNDATQGTTENPVDESKNDGTNQTEDNVDHNNLIEDVGEGVEDVGRGVEDLGKDTEDAVDDDNTTERAADHQTTTNR